MGETALAITYLGRALITLIISIALCFIASKGYNILLKYQDEHKKIEVRTNKDSNSN